MSLMLFFVYIYRACIYYAHPLVDHLSTVICQSRSALFHYRKLACNSPTHTQFTQCEHKRAQAEWCFGINCKNEENEIEKKENWNRISMNVMALMLVCKRYKRLSKNKRYRPSNSIEIEMPAASQPFALPSHPYIHPSIPQMKIYENESTTFWLK